MSSILILCFVLAGPIAITATEVAKDGDLIELPQGDFDQLVRWGIVREATEAERAAHQGEKADAPPDPEETPESTSPRETAAQRKKRLAEEAEAARIAEEEAAKTTETQGTEPT
jgi:hypothetical protein